MKKNRLCLIGNLDLEEHNFSNQKIYKSLSFNSTNIHPSDLKWSLDDCFFNSFIDIEGELA